MKMIFDLQKKMVIIEAFYLKIQRKIFSPFIFALK
jgi:hypothetical protein